VGKDELPNGTFAGFSLDEDYPLAFVIIVEKSGSGSSACLPVLSKVLTACMDAL